MAKQNINYGTVAGDGTGDNLFNAFKKAKENFDEIYETPRFGFYNFQHGATTQAILANTWTDITNDGTGALTSTTAGLEGVNIYNPSTGLIDFSNLEIYDSITTRFQATNVLTTVNNQIVKLRVLLSVGSLNVSLSFFYQEYDVSGNQDSVYSDTPIYILSELTRTFPAKFQIWSSAPCTLDLDGFNFRVDKRIPL